jgi:hypothetical protein
MEIKAVIFRRQGTIIAEVTEEEDFIYMKNPVEVILNRGENEDFFLTFIPFMHFTEEAKTGVKVAKTDVMSICTPLPQVAEHYKSGFKPQVTTLS